MRTTSDNLQYTESEVRSVLPTGWNLVGSASGGWDSKKKVWAARVIDNVEFDWPVVVKPDEASKLGRLEALRQAMDRVYRERLG
jgi:hypothetical protein